eukprot:TRINITY_DN1579_c3_g1_i1.p1 TRINITY_DN1579_c3_g1~~TRINITY_DN1579_c3_g1_i1.p1  ORF type:complete len:369 (-),score=96.76 TRINITY_DN1579_c3_g1_i1:163-1269(-)
MALPAAKIGTLLVRQLAKPVATRIKALASEHPNFRRGCVGFAQMWHRWQHSWTLRLRGVTPVHIAELDEARAVSLGAEVVGEAVVFGVGIGVLAWEYKRQSAKDKEKLAQLHAQLDDLQEQITEIQLDMIEMMRRNEFTPSEITKRKRVMQEVQEKKDIRDSTLKYSWYQPEYWIPARWTRDAANAAKDTGKEVPKPHTAPTPLPAVTAASEHPTTTTQPAVTSADTVASSKPRSASVPSGAAAVPSATSARTVASTAPSDTHSKASTHSTVGTNTDRAPPPPPLHQPVISTAPHTQTSDASTAELIAKRKQAAIEHQRAVRQQQQQQQQSIGSVAPVIAAKPTSANSGTEVAKNMHSHAVPSDKDQQ